jgi:hypothetical protein
MTKVDVGVGLFDLLQPMRGFPPLQIFILGLLFAVLAVPLVQLTGKASPALGADKPQDSSVVKGGTEHPEGEHKHIQVPALIRLRYAHRPESISLKSEGEELLTNLDLSSPLIEIKTDIEISHQGNEFSLEAQWPGGTPDTALTLEIEPDGFDMRSETRWSSEAALHEILTLIW